MHIHRIVFSVTNQCTGKCKHCQLGDQLNCSSAKVNIDKGRNAIQKLSQMFTIESMMTFGGEPLLYADVTCALHETAKQCNIAGRGIITNGFFSKNREKIAQTAQRLIQSGVNSILLSVDAFHQEIIPIEFVHFFAEKIVEQDFKNIKLHPAWLVNSDHANPYNQRTRELLAQFSDLNIQPSGGNAIFLSGNAAKYLNSYYEKKEVDLDFACGKFPYTTPLDKIDEINIAPNGDVNVCHFIIGNIYEEDIEEIIQRYNPHENVCMNLILNKGVRGLVDFAAEHDISVDTTDLHSACSICKALIKKISCSTSMKDL